MVSEVVLPFEFQDLVKEDPLCQFVHIGNVAERIKALDKNPS